MRLTLCLILFQVILISFSFASSSEELYVSSNHLIRDEQDLTKHNDDTLKNNELLSLTGIFQANINRHQEPKNKTRERKAKISNFRPTHGVQDVYVLIWDY